MGIDIIISQEQRAQFEREAKAGNTTVEQLVRQRVDEKIRRAKPDTKQIGDCVAEAF